MKRTDDTEAAASLDRLFVVEDGRVVESGKPRESLADPEAKVPRAVPDRSARSQGVRWVEQDPARRRVHRGAN